MTEDISRLVAARSTAAVGPSAPSRRTLSRFALGTLELLIVATLSMLLVDQVTSAALAALDLTAVLLRPEGVAVVMTVDIAVGTTVWMLHRRRTTRSIVAVFGATAASFALSLVPFWLGLVSAMDAVILGHLLVIPALALTVAVLGRELGPVRYPDAVMTTASTAARRRLDRIARRWPTVLALLLTFGTLIDPTVAPAPILVLLGVEYLIIGAIRGRLRDRRLLALHVAGAAAYTALAVLALLSDPFMSGLLIAAGWLLHAGWDLALHRANVVTWRWYAEACAVIDVVIGVTVIVALVS